MAWSAPYVLCLDIALSLRLPVQRLRSKGRSVPIPATRFGWCLRINEPFDNANVTCSWVAAVLRADGTPAVLKIGMPHMEGEDEIHGLRFWNGDPRVQLLEADDERGAMLLERCLPGYMLRFEPEEKQDLVIAALLKRLWRRSTSLNGIHAFRHLSELLNVCRRRRSAKLSTGRTLAWWAKDCKSPKRSGSQRLQTHFLPRIFTRETFCGSQREPWVVIDPKPFVGDPPYDVVQHLHN